MLRISLLFAGIGIFCWFFADIEITTLDPWVELGRFGWGLLTPNFFAITDFQTALLNTITFALCGIAISIVAGSCLAFFFEWRPVRLFCAFIRAIHEIFWALMFLPIVGLNPMCGILAIAVPYSGVFAKVYAEIRQESNQAPLSGLPPSTNRFIKFFYGILPVIYADIKHYTSYRFECALRSSAILGFIGLPTLGFHLETAFREGMYSDAAAMLFCFYLLIASLRFWLKPKVAWLFVAISFALISKEIQFSWHNMVRFFTYDVLPWPMRRTGVLEGSQTVDFPVNEVWSWMLRLFQEQGLPGIWNTVILTQIVLVGTAILTLVSFPLISKHFYKKLPRGISHFVLIVMRTTPEYILAYLMLQLWGPSMLPAVMAIALHNGAIISYLSGQNADLIQLRQDSPNSKINLYFFEILPRVYGQFLAFLFYRWEVMMRESAILGILGIYTLGFFIDSSIAEDKMDRAVFLIILTALLNMAIDTTSQLVRKRLKVSVKQVTSD